MNPLAVVLLAALTTGIPKAPPPQWSCYDTSYGCGCFLQPAPSNDQVCSANALYCISVVDMLTEPAARACMCFSDADRGVRALETMAEQPWTKAHRVERCPVTPAPRR